MFEKELPDTTGNRILSPCWDDNEEYYDDMDDEFCSESYDVYQSIEDKELLDPEDDDFEDLDFCS